MRFRLRGAWLVCWVAAQVVAGRLPASVQQVPMGRAPGRYLEHMLSGGVERSYILRVPAQYDATRPLPLVILLHGWMTSAAQAEAYTKFGEVSELRGFILAAPDGLGSPQGWNVGYLDLSLQRADDVGYVERLISRVENEVGVDPDRIYVVGHSNGAMLAELVGSKLGNKLAAMAAVSGTSGLYTASGGFDRIPDPIAPIAVMIIHGKQDKVVAYDSKSHALLGGIGARESAEWWAAKIGAAAVPTIESRSNGNVVTRTYACGRNGTEVKFITIKNGAHDWPGGLTAFGPETTSGVNAADLIWSFFMSHPRRIGEGGGRH